MLQIHLDDVPALELALAENGLGKFASFEVSGSFVAVTLPSFNDEQSVMDFLDHEGVGFSYIHQ